ncbi:LexA family transcriptional regulator [Enterococcus sp. DIV1283b]|uniref:LexA family transcriptional regulator n=1 Tax=Enterococcus sp. DIV1283b TaxID=2774745 RepID=UPI003F297549
MNREEFIKQLIISKYGTIKNFSEFVNVPYTTIRSILERGIGKAGIDNVIKICKGLEISPEQLSNDFTLNEHISNTLSTMYLLNDYHQQKVYDFARHELEDQNRSNVIQDNFGRAVDEDEKQEVSYVGLLSAGHGYPNYDKERPLGTVTMRKSQIPSYYDLAFMVDGNSMCPTFENGEIVFIKQTTEVLNGQFGAIEINGEAFLKKMYVENQRLRLVSLNCEYNENGNRLYPDFYADEYDDLYVIGRVIV